MILAKGWRGEETVLATVESVKIESDDRGFELHLTDTDGQRYILNVHAVAGDLLEQVRSEIGEWYAQGQALAAEHERERVPDEDGDCGYDQDDPKHSTWAERMTS